MVPLKRLGGDHGVYVFLRGGRAKALLAHIDDLGFAAGKFQNFRSHQTVVNYHVRLVQRATGFHRQQFRVTGASAHETDVAFLCFCVQVLMQQHL